MHVQLCGIEWFRVDCLASKQLNDKLMQPNLPRQGCSKVIPEHLGQHPRGVPEEGTRDCALQGKETSHKTRKKKTGISDEYSNVSIFKENATSDAFNISQECNDTTEKCEEKYTNI